MHAVVVSVRINDPEAAEKMLREHIVPRVKEAPGLVHAYWARTEDGRGGSMIVLESEEAARAVAEEIQGGQAASSEAVSMESVEVREVVAHL